MVDFKITASVDDAIRGISGVIGKLKEASDAKAKLNTRPIISMDDMNALRLGVKELRKHKIYIDENSISAKKFDDQMDYVLSTLRKFGKTLSADGREVVEFGRDINSLINPTDKAANSTKKLSKEVSATGAVFQKANTWVSSYIGNLAAYGTIRVFGFLKNQIRAAVGEAMEFDKLMTQVKVLAPDINQAAFSSELLDRSAKFGINAVKAADAMIDIASSGSKTPDRMFRVFEESAKLGTGYMADMKESTQAVIGVMNSYSTETKDLSKNSDIMAQMIDQGIIRFKEIGSKIGQVAPLAANAGVSFEDLAAGTAHFTKQGAPFSTAVVSAKQAISNLISPSTRSVKMLKQLGVEADADTLATEGLSGTIQKLNKATGGSVKFLNTFNGNIRASQYVMTQTGGATKGYAETLKQFQNVTGKSEQAFKDMTNTIDFQVRQTESEFRKNIIKGIMPMIATLKDQLIGIDKADYFSGLTEGLYNFSIKSVEVTGAVISSFHGMAIAAAKAGSAITAAAQDMASTLTLGYADNGDAAIAEGKRVVSELEKDQQGWIESTNKTLSNLRKNINDFRSGKSKPIFATDEQKEQLDKLFNKNKKAADAIADGIVDSSKKFKSYADVLNDLNKEYAAMGKNSVQVRTINQLAEMGVDITKVQVDEMGRIYKGTKDITNQYGEMHRVIQEIDNTDFMTKQKNSMKTFSDSYRNSMMTLADVTTNSFKNAEDSVIEFAKTGKFSFSDFVSSAIEDLSRLMIQMQMMNLASGLTGMFSGGSGGVDFGSASFAQGLGRKPSIAAATGGFISGPGNGTSDSIPARLSNGEFVMNAKATSRYRGVLEQMNSNRFANGGAVGGGSSGGALVQIVDQRGANAPAIKQEESTGPNGERILRMIINAEVNRGLYNGSYDAAMSSNYRAKRTPMRK